MFRTTTAALALLAANAAAATGAADETAEADQRIVDVCNRAAANGPLGSGAAALCSEAYERLLEHYGGYGAYAEARHERDAANK
jgi:hypothetical protein